MNIIRPLSFCALLAVAAVAPVGAQTAEPVPTEITSVALEMWSTDTEIHAIFNGNVTVTGTQLKMTCDRLEVIANRTGDKTETTGKADRFKYLLATGKVNIVQGDREASCGRAEVFPQEEKIVLMEKPVVIDHGTEFTATGEPLILLRGERRVLGDNVKMTGPAIKDLGFDKNKPATQSTPAPAATTATQPKK